MRAAPLALALAAVALPASASPSWEWGSKDGHDCLAAMVGGYPRAVHYHMTPATFPAMVSGTTGWLRKAAAADAAKGADTLLASFALVPSSAKGQFAACSAGQFDTYWNRIAAAVAAYPIGRKVVEPGWEANIGSGSHPWGVDDASQLPAYKACFRRVAGIFHAAPGVEVAWTSSKVYRKNFTVDQMSPGDDAYDVVGLMYYDNYTPLQSQATWDRYVDSHLGTGGSPSGIGSWLAYARAHGKKFGVSEWGLWDTARVSTAQADDPVYVADMYAFFKANAADISHETYQNNSLSTTDGHELCPSTTMPAASATYGRLWSQP